MTLLTAAEKEVGARLEQAGSLPVGPTWCGQAICDGVVQIFRVLAQPDRLVFGWTVQGAQGELEHVAVVANGDLGDAFAVE